MAKKHKKSRKHRQKKPLNRSQEMTSLQLLQGLKSLFNAGRWIEALDGYRTWTKRTGKKRDVVLENELLFRIASYFYEKGDYRKAVQRLDEALEKDPNEHLRCHHYAGVCLVKMGEYEKSSDRFGELSDEYHREVLRYLSCKDNPLPKEPAGDHAFERSMLLKFWKSLLSGQEIAGSSTALRNIGEAYRLFVSGGDPAPKLKLLSQKPGFEPLALHLLLLHSVYGRRNIKIRNLVKNNVKAFDSPDLCYLLGIHMLYLLKEKNYNEVTALDSILDAHGIKPELLERIRDEVLFSLGLAEIEKNNLESALDYFKQIQKQTPAVLHNKALLFQKLEMYDEANRYWIRLHQKERKPKRSDPEEVRTAYITTLKYIARNYLNEGRPEDAFIYFKEAYDLDRDDRETLEYLREVSVDLENDNEALMYAGKLYEIEPDNEEYLVNYIMSLTALGHLEAVIPLYRAGLEKNAESPFYRYGLAACNLKNALEVRKEDADKAKEHFAEAKRLGGRGFKESMFHFPYLEGYWLKDDGNKKAAEKKFEKAIGLANDHLSEFLLGKFFYADNMADYSMELFKKITSCKCVISREIFESIVEFLAEAGDRRNAGLLCNMAIKKKGYVMYFIASMLLDYNRPSWAGEYTSRMIREEEADEDDRYLHLLVLNEMGNRQNTLQYAQLLKEERANCGDSEGASIYSYFIKQIKTRGRFKTPDD